MNIYASTITITLNGEKILCLDGNECGITSYNTENKKIKISKFINGNMNTDCLINEDGEKNEIFVEFFKSGNEYTHLDINSIDENFKRKVKTIKSKIVIECCEVPKIYYEILLYDGL